MPQSMKALHGPVQEGFQEISEERKDWLLPPNYLDKNKVRDMTSVTSPKPPIKEELRTEEKSITSPKQRSVDGDQITPSTKIKKKKKIGKAITKNK